MIRRFGSLVIRNAWQVGIANVLFALLLVCMSAILDTVPTYATEVCEEFGCPNGMECCDGMCVDPNNNSGG